MDPPPDFEHADSILRSSLKNLSAFLSVTLATTCSIDAFCVQTISYLNFLKISFRLMYVNVSLPCGIEAKSVRIDWMQMRFKCLNKILASQYTVLVSFSPFCLLPHFSLSRVLLSQKIWITCWKNITMGLSFPVR